MSSQYIIPDLLATWPWKRTPNPMLDEVKDEANAWVKSYALFEPVQLQRFYACDFNLLAALIAPTHSKEHFRLTCDLMNLLFAFDEYTDVTTKIEATTIVNDFMDAFGKDSIHSSHHKIAAMAQEFFQRTLSVLGENVFGMERFISDLDAYTKAVILEAEDRVTGRLRTINDCISLRRDTIAARAVYSFLGLGLDIPDSVFEHPFMMSLLKDAQDLMGIPNEVHSYSFEHSRGLDGHNVITAIMREYHLDLQQALHWMSGYTFNTISNFLSNSRALPSWGEEIDQVVRVYIDRVGWCIRGCDAWSRGCHRYYGGDGSGEQEFSLLPPDSGFVTREQLGLEILVAC